jgi:hypothetical protein
MNTTCCCNTKGLRWYNNGKNVINVSSDFIDYRKYASVACLTGKVNACFGDLPNLNSASGRTASLKGNIIYNIKVCNPYNVAKTCNPYQYQYKSVNNYGCKCICTSE